MGEQSKLVQLSDRAGYKPDVGAMARDQLATARRSAGLTAEEFADRLTTLIGWTPSREVVESWEDSVVPPGDVLVAASLISHGTVPAQSSGPQTDVVSEALAGRYADVSAVYATRSEFISAIPPHELFDRAKEIRAAGLSLNILCQHYTESSLQQLIRSGAKLKCLFLDPRGEAIAQREQEEGYPKGHLSALTELNIQTIMYRVRDRLPMELRQNVEVATYDETIRFNIMLLDSKTGIVQPYLPEARGIDSPTLVINRRSPVTGLYTTFDQIFNAMWERGQPL